MAGPATRGVTAPRILKPPPVRVASTGTSATAIHSKLVSILATSTSASRSSAVDVTGLGQVLRQNADTAVLPASTEKLYTTLTALKVLGAYSTLRTEVRAAHARQGSTQPGDLYLVGGGDAFLSSTQLDSLANAVHASGITRITGALVVDESRYDAVRRGPGWKTAFVPEDSGPLSALALDSNAWRTDSGYLNDPALPTLERFRQLLLKHGVSVGTAHRHGRADSTTRLVASVSSAPLQNRLRAMDKASNNFAAELLLKEIGLKVRGVGSTSNGAAAVRSTMSGLGVGYGTVMDGSGLSSGDRQTARDELSLLVASQASAVSSVMRAVLPVACKDGTLVHRMCNTAAAGRAIAKTGTLPGTYALAGYTFTRDGNLVSFSFLLSKASSGDKARAAIDACVVYLSGVQTG